MLTSLFYIYDIFCGMSNKDVNERLYKIVRLFRKPSLIHDTKLSIYLSQVADGIRPFLGGFKCCKVQRFKQCRVAWKHASLTVKPSVRGVQALNGIGCVNGLPDRERLS